MIQKELYSKQSLFDGYCSEIYIASNFLSKFIKYKWIRSEWLKFIVEFFQMYLVCL